ncbi:MAG TPA: hypothetical protein VJ788_06690, partial [Gemmatimonadota bacterium]|nr:hypothetical protein [Gemmatimonadota bacterium]
MRIPGKASRPRKPAAKRRGSKRAARAGAWDDLEAVAGDVSGGASEVARALLAWGESWAAGGPGTAREALVGLERLAR